MNASRGHAGFDLEDALAGAYGALERDPDAVKFSVSRALDGQTTMIGSDGQTAGWRQERTLDGWRDVDGIVFGGAMTTPAFKECAARVRARNG